MLAQLLACDLLARQAADVQPAKLAALEGQFRTERGAPLRIGGWPDPVAVRRGTRSSRPRRSSLLATHDPDGLILGLDAFPRDEWPETRVVHPSFQLMVGAGLSMLALALWWSIVWWRGRSHGAWARHRRLLWALLAGAPLGFLALEAGWHCYLGRPSAMGDLSHHANDRGGHPGRWGRGIARGLHGALSALDDHAALAPATAGAGHTLSGGRGSAVASRERGTGMM